MEIFWKNTTYQVYPDRCPGFRQNHPWCKDSKSEERTIGTPLWATTYWNVPITLFKLILVIHSGSLTPDFNHFNTTIITIIETTQKIESVLLQWRSWVTQIDEAPGGFTWRSSSVIHACRRRARSVKASIASRFDRRTRLAAY